MPSPSHVPFANFGEIEHLVARFEQAALPRTEWTHRAHLTVAAWYLSGPPPAEATPLIRDGILKLNAALGIVSDADHGYHETITQFYIGMIAHHLRTAGVNQQLVTALNALLATRGHASLPFKYYRREHLMSRAVRAHFLPPDLRPSE